MNRRTFTQALGAAAFSAAAPMPSSGAAAPAAKLPPYSLSVMLWTAFPKLPFVEQLEKVAEAGYNQVQLVGEYRLKNWTADDYARANAARKRLGMRIDTTAGLAHGVADPAARDAFLADLRDALKSMETLGTSDIIVLSGDVVPGLARETQHQSCVETLKRAAAMVEGKQIDGRPVRIQFETIDPLENPKYYLTSMIENFEVVRAVNHPQVRALYDFFHEQIAEGNLIAKLEKNMDILGLVHVADVPGRHHPGSGEINYGNIFRKLAELNYQHTIAMEFVPLGDGVAELRKAKELALSAGAV